MKICSWLWISRKSVRAGLGAPATACELCSRRPPCCSSIQPPFSRCDATASTLSRNSLRLVNAQSDVMSACSNTRFQANGVKFCRCPCNDSHMKDTFYHHCCSCWTLPVRQNSGCHNDSQTLYEGQLSVNTLVPEGHLRDGGQMAGRKQMPRLGVRPPRLAAPPQQRPQSAVRMQPS